jgi:hypothetical protein
MVDRAADRTTLVRTPPDQQYAVDHDDGHCPMDETAAPLTETDDEHAISFAPPALRALLVGIDRYVSPTLKPLRGCVNDVDAARDVLVDEFGVPADAVMVLRDAEATRAGIEAAFRAHLIAAGTPWAEEEGGTEPPAFLFYFSGHGSQARDLTGTEPDGYDETLVPHDARDDGAADIRDYELAAWLDQLPGDNVTVVLDCCHSGSGTDRGRVARPDELIRSAPRDERPVQPPRPAELGPTPGVTIDPGGRHVLLAACASHENAYEHRRSDGVRHGLFSQALLPALARLRTRPDLTYRELVDDARLRVTTWRHQQTPHGEGDIDRVVFGTQRVRRRPLASVVARRQGLLVLDVGEVHGIREGFRFSIEVDAIEPVVVEVERAHAVTCEARPVAGSSPPTSPPPLGAPALLVRAELGARRWRVACDADGAQDLVTATDHGGPLDGLVLVDDDPAAADLRLVHSGSRWGVSTPDGEQLVEAQTLDGAIAGLTHLARCADVWATSGPASLTAAADGSSPIVLRDGAPPEGCISLRLRSVTTNEVTGELELEDPPAEGVPEGQRIAFELHNGTDQELYPCLLAFGRDWDVRPLYPAAGARSERWRAGEPFVVGMGRTTFTATLAADEDERRDVVRLVVTTEPTSYVACELLPPPGDWAPARPLRAPADEAIAPQPSGPVVIGAARVVGDWASTSVEVVTRRATPSEPQPPAEPG